MEKQRLSFRSSRMASLWFPILVVFAVSDGSFALGIYVSVDGGAQADGSLAKPYGSLPDAVKAVRTSRKAGNTKPMRIILREGRHPKGGSAYAERRRRGSRGAGPKLIETDMDNNLYYHPTDPHFVDEHLRRMRAAGKEKASRFGDPLFVDPAGGDFSFRPDSPALKLGIEPLDASKMGRLDD